MVLKLSLVITFLLVTIVSATEEVKKDEPFSIENVWKKSAGCGCKSKPNWTKDVQKYYDDIIVAFDSFPGQLSDVIDYVKTTFQTILTKLIEYTNSKSKILSTGATAVLEAFASVQIDGQTGQGVIDAFLRALPILMKAYRGIVTSFTKIIGSELVCAVNKAITDAECAFKTYMEEFNAGDGNGLKVEIDYQPVMKRVQTLTNTISLMGEATLTKCQLATPEVQDALVILSLILDHIVICTHGLSGCSEAVLLEQKCEEPPVVLHVCVVTMAVFMTELTQSIAVNTVPNAENVPAHLRNVVDLTTKLNVTLKNLFGMVNDVTLTVGKITQQLSNSLRGITNGVVSSLRLIG